MTVFVQHKNTLWRTALATNSPRDIKLFREVRNQYTESVRKAKACFFKQKFASCCTNSQKSWDTVKFMENKTTLDVVYHGAIHFVTKAPYTTHHCDLYALVGWPSLHTRSQTHWLQVIYKSLLGKAPSLSQLTDHHSNTHP